MDPESEAAHRVGTTLCNKWTLERLIGEGGMAAVYVANLLHIAPWPACASSRSEETLWSRSTLPDSSKCAAAKMFI